MLDHNRYCSLPRIPTNLYPRLGFVLLLLAFTATSATAEEPANWADYLREGGAAVGRPGSGASHEIAASPVVRGTATCMFFADRPTFEGSFDGLVTEDFEAANLPAPPGDFAAVAVPLDSSSDDGVFAPGDIEFGLTLDVVEDPASGLFMFGPGVFSDSKIIGPNNFIDTLELRFVPDLTEVVGFDIVNQDDLAFQITAFGDGDLPLFDQTVPGATADRFFGAACDLPVRRVLIEGLSEEFIDNVTFTGANSEALPIPTLDQWAVGLLALLLALAAGLRLARGRRAGSAIS